MCSGSSSGSGSVRRRSLRLKNPVTKDKKCTEEDLLGIQISEFPRKVPYFEVVVYTKAKQLQEQSGKDNDDNDIKIEQQQDLSTEKIIIHTEEVPPASSSSSAVVQPSISSFQQEQQQQPSANNLVRATNKTSSLISPSPSFSSSISCSQTSCYHAYDDIKDDYVLSQEVQVDETTTPLLSPLFGGSSGGTRADMKRDLERYLEEQEDAFFETEEGKEEQDKEKEKEEVDYFDDDLDDSDWLSLI